MFCQVRWRGVHTLPVHSFPSPGPFPSDNGQVVTVSRNPSLQCGKPVQTVTFSQESQTCIGKKRHAERNTMSFPGPICNANDELTTLFLCKFALHNIQVTEFCSGWKILLTENARARRINYA